ncbi:MAG TPA: hypothetical protein VIR30_12055 [Nocardioides sp.]
MITHCWRERLEAQELVAIDHMLALAADFDEEAGFSTATPAVPGHGGDVHHLLVRMPPKGERESPDLDALPDAEVVGYLRLEVADGTGSVQLVIRPEFRSLGVATLLFERLDSESDGWASIPGLRVLRAWSHGAHPAADRMCRRFDARLEHALFKTLRQIGGSRPFDGDPLPTVERIGNAEVPELMPDHDLTMAPAEKAALKLASSTITDASGARTILGAHPEQPASTAAVLALVHEVGTPVAALKGLLTQGLLDLQECGARTAQLYVDALDDAFVSASRELEFIHDQSDLLYARELPV